MSRRLDEPKIWLKWDGTGHRALLRAVVHLPCRTEGCGNFRRFTFLLGPTDNTGKVFEVAHGTLQSAACQRCGVLADMPPGAVALVRKTAAKRHGPDVVKFWTDRELREELWSFLSWNGDPLIVEGAERNRVDVLQVYIDCGEDRDALLRKFASHPDEPAAAWEDVVPSLVARYAPGEGKLLTESFLGWLLENPDEWKSQGFRSNWRSGWRSTLSIDELNRWWVQNRWSSGLGETQYFLGKLMKCNFLFKTVFGRPRVAYIVQKGDRFGWKEIKLHEAN